MKQKTSHITKIQTENKAEATRKIGSFKREKEAITVELTGKTEEISKTIDQTRENGIKEIVRTEIVVLPRGFKGDF